MTNAATPSVREPDASSPVEIAVRIGILVLWATWCFRIIHPLLSLLVWAVVIAVAVHPLHRRLTSLLGERARSSAAVLTIILLLVVVAPVVLFAGAIVNNVRSIAGEMADGTLTIPPPPESVATWPLIGRPLSDAWGAASSNLQAALAQHAPEIKAAGAWLLEVAAGAGVGMIEFIVAVIIAGVLLLHSAAGHRVAVGIGRRLAGPRRGPQLAELAENTVRGVARGVLGVALIQALLAGLGLFVAGVPGAGLWALICLILCVVQIGTGPVLIPAVIYVFVNDSTMTAVLFLAWSAMVMVIDNVLKPLLMGRGLEVPMVVVFLGAIGGMVVSGIIGLFVGAVILALGYKLFQGWLEPERLETMELSVRSE